jgi:hypothetical protein
MTGVEKLKKPFGENAEFLSALISARNDAGRLQIVRHRLEQSKNLPSRVDLTLVVDVVTMIPHHTTDDWMPSDSFVNDFLEGKIRYNRHAIVGGPDPMDTTNLELSDPEF